MEFFDAHAIASSVKHLSAKCARTLKMKNALLWAVSAAALVAAQLSGPVGPTTSREAKAAKKVCNIANYGGVASPEKDNSAAITKAWDDCKNGGQVLVPSGTFGLDKWVDLSGGKGVSINLEGVISRMSNGTAGGNMIAVQDTDDFEFFSGNSKGAIQGKGYEFHKRESLLFNMVLSSWEADDRKQRTNMGEALRKIT